MIREKEYKVYVYSMIPHGRNGCDYRYITKGTVKANNKKIAKQMVVDYLIKKQIVTVWNAKHLSIDFA